MKKKIIKILIIILSIALIGIFLFFNFSIEKSNNSENIEEIKPEEETIEEESKTKIKLYFEDSTSGILVAEEREILTKDLIDNPYMFVLKELLKGPTKDGLKSAIPDNVKINSVSFKSGTLNIDLSNEFLNSSGTNPIYSIVNTMCEFNEVEEITITINGESKPGLSDVFVRK